MHITQKNLTDTNLELTIVCDEAQLAAVKQQVVSELSKDVNLTGFRKGHAPAAMVERAIDPNTLNSRFLDAALNDAYGKALTEKNIRPVTQPEVSVTKFVPFTTLEFTVKVEAVGQVKLGDYKKLKLKRVVEAVTDADIQGVMQRLQDRQASKEEVKRAAKDGDEVTIDFTGVDAKTKDAISGASGADYPLVIGSNTFIPGFEPELIGLKAGGEKTFDVTFPADYGSKDLQKKKVTFSVTVKKVSAVKPPKLDDAFAATVGPFKTIKELEADVRTQLENEKANQADQAFESELIDRLSEVSSVSIPKVLVDEEIDRMEAEEKRNLVYRGQTWQEHLDAEGKTEEEHREGQREQATSRVKAGLVLAEVSQVEGISVSRDELQNQITRLKQQYPDDKMKAELDKPENQRDIASRLLTEKTIDKLVGYVAKA